MLRACFLLISLMAYGAPRAQTFFEHLTKADGLPGDQVLALHEDRNGFIWIGTDAGLARHEGVRIRTWFHDRKDAHSLSNDVVWDITEDEHGRVWIATDHGLCGYDARTGGFDRVFITAAYHDPTSANRIHRIAADGHGRLWLSTEDGVHTVSLVGDPSQTPLPAGGSRIARLTDRQRAYGLAMDTIRGGVWINGAHGLVFFDVNSVKFLTTSSDAAFACLNDTLAQDAYPDGAGGLWYFTSSSNSLVHRNAQGRIVRQMVITSGPNQLVNPQFIRLDRSGLLWLSTWSHELRVFDGSTGLWRHFAHDADVPWSIVSSNTKSWLQDRDGRIWLGTIRGLDVIDPARNGMRPYLIGKHDEDLDITDLLVPGTNTVLIGTNGGGLVKLDRGTGEQRTLRHAELPIDPAHVNYLNHIRCSGPYRDGWLLGTHEGLLHLDTTAWSLTRPNDLLMAQPKLGFGTISFIAADTKGNTWIGKWKGGLYKIDPNGSAERFDSIAHQPVPSRMLLCAAAAPDGIWAGFNDGAGACLIRNDSIVMRLLHEPDSTGANYGVVTSLALDHDGTLYIGTLMGGFGAREPVTGRITWYTRSDGLSGDRVEDLVLDKGDGLWIRTNDGVCRFDRATRTIDRLTLPAAVRAQGSLNAIALDVDGSLLCAYGPLLIDVPTTTPTHRSGPEVVLTGLRFGDLSNASWQADSTIELRHEQRALTVEYGVRAYFSGQETRFAYRVADLDTVWHSLGTTTRLDLNDLPPGDHRVQVRANNGGSAWTQRPLALNVRVLPPMWATWWFRLAAITVLASLLFFAFRLYLREQLRRERARSEREQAVLHERMRIAGDMHDDLGAGLSALKLRSEMALRVEKDPMKRQQLGSLANTAGDLIGSMRQIIWTMNADQTSLEDLVVYTTSYARTYCGENELVIEVRTDNTWPPLSLSTEQRRNIFLVVKEALHNVVKHAAAHRVALTMCWSGSLQVEIGDDGIGLMSGAETGEGNGMRNMRKRVEVLGGAFEMEGGTGTTLRFRIPLGHGTNERSIATPRIG